MNVLRRSRWQSVCSVAPKFVGICLVLFGLSGTAQATPGLKACLQKGLDKGYIGIAALIQKSGEKRRSAAAGYADLENKKLLDPADAFHIASITKTFTAAAILKLSDDGKLSLSRTLKDLLGDVVKDIPDAEKITITQLLDHSSGIYATNNDPEYLATLIGENADPNRIWKPLEFIALANESRRKALGEPGSGHYYSDTNYVLLGLIVEKVSGETFKHYIERTFFKPLGMKSTYFYSEVLAGKHSSRNKPVRGYLRVTPEIEAVLNISSMYKKVPGFEKDDSYLLNTTLGAERIDSAAGIVSTLSDMYKFASALFRGQLLKAASQKMLMTTFSPEKEAEFDKSHNRTLQSMRKPFGLLIYKQGDGPGGVNTLMAYSREKDLIFVGFTNTFGFFDEVDFMIDSVLAPALSGNC